LSPQDNIIHGRFLAELTKEVLLDLEASKYQHAELRISIYGRKRVEWDILAAWVCQHHIYSDNVIWLIQARATKLSLLLTMGSCSCAQHFTHVGEQADFPRIYLPSVSARGCLLREL